MRLLLPSLFFLRVHSIHDALHPLPPQMPIDHEGHDRVARIPERTDKTKYHHARPDCEAGSAVSSGALGATEALGLPEGGPGTGRVEAGSEHQDGRDQHHKSEADAEGQSQKRRVAAKEEVCVKGGDGVEKGQAGDEEGLEDFATGKNVAVSLVLVDNIWTWRDRAREIEGYEGGEYTM